MDGTSIVKDALLQIFHKLDKNHRDDGIPIFKPEDTAPSVTKEQSTGITTSTMMEPNADTVL